MTVLDDAPLLCRRCGHRPSGCGCPGGGDYAPAAEVMPRPRVVHRPTCAKEQLKGNVFEAQATPCDCGADRGTEVGQPAADAPSLLDQYRAALVDSRGLDGIPDPVPLIDGLIYRDTLAWLHGKPGHGKSFVALDWAGCVAGGLPWHAHDVAAGRVLYLVAEGVAGVRQRVRAWEEWTRTEMTGVAFLPIAVQVLVHGQLSAFVELLTEVRPALVIVDTQARVTVGADENSAQDMGRLVAALERIRTATGACVLLVHHESRAGENMRGSTAMEGAAESVIRVHKDGPHIRLDNTKQKNAPEHAPMLLRLAPYGPSAVLQSHDGVGLDEELSNSEQRLMDTMRDTFGTTGAAATVLMETAEVPKSSFYRALNRLVSKGMLTNVGTDKRPKYALPGSGADE